MNIELNMAREARQLLRTHRYGVLSTVSKKFSGYPFGSITPYLVDHEGDLIIFISSLAEHTKNIQHDARVSLIIHEQNNDQIQAQGRVTLIGTAQRISAGEDISPRYLQYFPESQAYLGMHDFSFFRIQGIAIRYIAGFGGIHWVDITQYRLARYPLIAQETDVIAHMNAEHQETMRQYCKYFLHLDVSTLAMVGVDCDGFDIRADGQLLRFHFSTLVLDAKQARVALIELSHKSQYK